MPGGAADLRATPEPDLHELFNSPNMRNRNQVFGGDTTSNDEFVHRITINPGRVLSLRLQTCF